MAGPITERWPPVHERCTEHKHKCANIQELKEIERDQWDAIGRCLTTKTAFSLLAILITPFLAMNGVIMSMTTSTLDEFAHGVERRNSQVQDLWRMQGEIQISITQLQGSVAVLKDSVQEIKQDLKEDQATRKHRP